MLDPCTRDVARRMIAFLDVNFSPLTCAVKYFGLTGDHVCVHFCSFAHAYSSVLRVRVTFKVRFRVWPYGFDIVIIK